MATCLELYGYDDPRDTGVCYHCKKELNDEERTLAVHGAVRHGITQFYACKECFIAWYTRPMKVNIEEAE